MSGSVQHVAREDWVETAERLRADGFVMLADLTCVDYLEGVRDDLPTEVAPERFEVVAVVRRMDPPAMVRLRAQVPDDDPVIDSLWSVFPGVEAFEREVYDLFGIHFRGHPDLSRILMPQDWEGHPLRKDYSVGRVPVQFKEVRRHR